MNQFVEAALNQMDWKTTGSSYEDAYTQLQRSADRMPDLEFMFEAGKRAARLELTREFVAKVRKAVLAALK